MYLVVLNFAVGSTEIMLYNDITGSDEENFDISSWVSERFGDDSLFMVCDYLNIEI